MYGTNRLRLKQISTCSKMLDIFIVNGTAPYQVIFSMYLSLQKVDWHSEDLSVVPNATRHHQGRCTYHHVAI